MSKVRLVCPTCGVEITEASKAGSVTCPGCGLSVTPIATSKQKAKALPVNREKGTNSENEPLINQRDYRPIKLMLNIFGWLCLLAGIILFALMFVFPTLPANIGSRPFVFSMYAGVLLFLGIALLFAKWRLVKYLEPVPPSRFS